MSAASAAAGAAARGSRPAADAALLVAAAIWGLGFVAQRVGMEFVGPLLFNGLRFLIGALALLPALLASLLRRPRGHARAAEQAPRRTGTRPATARRWRIGLGAGLLLTGGATFQQFGIVSTTAGNAGFVTGLYLVLVPLIAVALGRRLHLAAGLGAALATTGLFLLTATGQLLMGFGDLLVLIGALFWALHLLYLERATQRVDPLPLAALQFCVCGTLSLGAAVVLEPLVMSAVLRAAGPILFGGLVSVAVGYTLQVIGQRGAAPTHAAIILSLEAVFAAVGGWLLLGERLAPVQLAGVVLMLSGMVSSQLAVIAVRPNIR